MKEITENQIKEFWEWCGFKYQGFIPSFGNIPEQKEAWRYPDGSMCFLSAYGTATGLPDINLDNLFKYAVSNVMESNQNFIDIQVRRYIAPGYDDFLISYTCEIWSDNGQGSVIKQADTPALALFWAILEVIKSETET